jgi:transcriptional regulator with XRE-family HTH domain
VSTRNPGLELLQKRVVELGLENEVADETAKIVIEHKIVELRRRRGFTQAELARRSGVSQSMIAQIESGKLNNLTLKTLTRTALALDATLRIDLVSQIPSARRRSRRKASPTRKLASS